MRGLAILLAFSLLGMAVQAAGVPLPGNVLGLIFLTAALFFRLVKLAWVEEAADSASQALHRRFGWIHPLLPTCGALMAILLIAKIPYPAYMRGGGLIVFFLTPATVALAVPLYRHADRMRAHALAILTAIAAGSVCGMASAALFVWALGGSHSLVLSMIPKSVTTPISMEVSRLIGGEPDLTAVFTVIAGLIGSVVGPWILRRAGVRGDLAIGAAMGTSSHGIGTARVIRESELQGAVAGLAMALAGIITSLLAIPIYWWLKR